MPSLLTINWNPDPELFNLFGSFPIRYYGLLGYRHRTFLHHSPAPIPG